MATVLGCYGDGSNPPYTYAVGYGDGFGLYGNGFGLLWRWFKLTVYLYGWLWRRFWTVMTTVLTVMVTVQTYCIPMRWVIATVLDRYGDGFRPV